MKRGLGKQTFVVSGKRSRYDNEEDSDSSQDPLEGSSNIKSLEELKALTWKLCESAWFCFGDSHKNRRGMKWIKKYPPMHTSRQNLCCCNDECLLVVASKYTVNSIEIMDTKKLMWKTEFSKQLWFHFQHYYCG